MSKRMKRVFNRADQVIHLWANRSQSDARSKNVYFSGDMIFSYGSHYLLGMLHEVKGQTIAVINSTRYSNTTSKHQSYAHCATSHIPTFSGSDPSNLVKSIREQKTELLNNVQKLMKKRSFYNTKVTELWDIQKITEFNNVISKVKGFQKYKIKLSTKFMKDLQQHVTKSIARRKELEKLRQTPEYIAKKERAMIRKQELALKKAQGEVDAWRQGGYTTNAVRSLQPQILRVMNDTVQTSRGAEVSLDQARRVLHMCLNNTIKQGDAVGDFKFEKFNSENVVQIGCHAISLVEAQNVLNSYPKKAS